METIQHKLQQFDPGIVWLDGANRITAMNGVAIKTLGDRRGDLVGEEVLQLHPEKSREKVKWLLDASSCPMESPPPMTMMINIPERVLMIKVAKMLGADGVTGTCMVFYDLTELTSAPAAGDSGEAGDAPLRLYKLPVYKDRQTLLVDLEDVCCIKAEGHYSTLYTEDGAYLCNLSLSDIEGRLDARLFVRVHRSYIANMRYAKAFEKSDDHCYLVVDYQQGLKIPISRANVAAVKRLLGLERGS